MGPWGLLVIGCVLVIVALATGFVVPGKDRDEWRASSQALAKQVERFADLLDDRRRR